MRRCPREYEGIVAMAYIEAEGPNQGTLFPVVIDDLIPSDHMCRVVDAFVEQLDMEKIGFERARPAETGRPGYDPRALLKLYLYGYLNQIRSSRRLEAECIRNCHAALKPRNHACLFSILFRDLTALSLH